jgi:hypothetical protein
MSYHLAQVNVARARGAMDDPVMKDFVDQLDHVNALAEGSPGFVWRLKTDVRDAAYDVRVFDDEMIIINMSVWESVEALRAYVYSGDHLRVLRRRHEWFQRMDSPALAMWWIHAGTEPTTDDAKAALEHIATHGPTPRAFTFGKPFSPPALEPTRPLAG